MNPSPSEPPLFQPSLLPMKRKRIPSEPDADHDDLDSKLAFLKPFHLSSELLLLYVATGYSLTSTKYKNVSNLQELSKTGEVQQLLQEAVHTGKFWKVRRILGQEDYKVSNIKRKRQDFGTGASELTATEKAWRVPYQGNYSNLLEKCITQMNSTRTYEHTYCNFVLIVQSSGTDPLKTRLVSLPVIMSHDVFLWTTLPNLRASQTRFLQFFAALFQVSRELIESRESIVEYWYQMLQKEGGRESLFSAALERQQLLSCHETYQEGNLKELESEVEREGQNLIETIESMSTSDGYISKPRQSTDAGKVGTRPVRILMYFDESYDLHRNLTSASTTVPSASTPYQVLCKALNSLCALDIFIVFLSTNPNLSKYSPRQRYWWSLRVSRDPTHPVQAPFVELPFDTWREKVLVSESTHTLDDVCQAEFMVRFGRPLFWTRYESGDLSVRQGIIQFAMKKLTAGYSDQLAGGTSNKEKSLALLAALAVRLLLTFEPTRESAVDTENQLIEGYMRYAYSVPEHREYLRSGAPSEPILAEAAARITSTLANSTAVELLDGWTANGLIAKGERGELVARLLFTFAHDAAIRKQAALSGVKAEGIWYSQPILLTDFLVALVGDDYAANIFESTPQNMSGSTFREAFKDARVHFTHFGKASDSSTINDEAAFAFICRGMAVQCFDRQADIDFFLPVLLWDKLLGRFVMTAVFVQIKNRHKVQAVHIDAEKLKFFTSGGGPEAESRPYVTIILHLEVQPNQRKTKAHPNVPIQSLTSFAAISKLVTEAGPTRQQAPQKGKICSKHPCYAFSIHGCSSAVYDVIERNQEAVYAKLLASRNFLAEHPHQDPEFLLTVERMKPLWRSGQQSFDWVKVDDQYPSRIAGQVATENEMENDHVHVHVFGEDKSQDVGGAEDEGMRGMLP